MSQSTNELARAIRDDWRDGQASDAQAALLEHPDLKQDTTAVLDLAYEEYSLARRRDEDIDLEAFCARFPECRSTLFKMLSADQMLAYHPKLLDAPGGVPRLAAFGDWPAVGAELQGCRLLRELGRGAFARVYLASELTVGSRAVALKVSGLPSNEADTLGPLHHDHVVPIYWARPDRDRGCHVVCMPFLGSATLEDVRDRLYGREKSSPQRGQEVLDAIARMARPGDLPPAYTLPELGLEKLDFVDSVARLGWRLADTLAFLHRKKVYHCDLKPSNVLLTAQGGPLLLDFNLARQQSKPSLHLGGTFPYMAPEQLEACLARQGLDSVAAARADLFALGVLLYELLCGALPYGGPPPVLAPNDAARDMLQRQRAGFRPLRQRRRDVPRRLARLVERCLALDPADRPADADEVAALLRPRPPRRLPRRAVVAGALVVLTAVLTLLAGWVSARLEGAAELHQRGQREESDGVGLLEAGEPASAEKHLQAAAEYYRRAIDRHKWRTGEERGNWEDYFGRGRVGVLLGQLSLAHEYFNDADDLLGKGNGPADRRGLVQAWNCYCLCRAGRHGKALNAGNRALAAGYRSPGLLNNLAHCVIQLKQNQAWEQAVRNLDEAIQGDPELRAGYHNRARLRYLLALRGVPQPPEVWPRRACLDVARAIDLGKKSGHAATAELFVLAARIHARAASESSCRPEQWPEHARKCRTYLEDAGARGADLNLLLGKEDEEAKLLREVLGDHDADELAKRPRKQVAPVSDPGADLVRPLWAPRD
jgi:tetratricopeptide (TPR) repeat protein